MPGTILKNTKYATKAWYGRSGSLCVDRNLIKCDIPKLHPY